MASLRWPIRISARFNNGSPRTGRARPSFGVIQNNTFVKRHVVDHSAVFGRVNQVNHSVGRLQQVGVGSCVTWFIDHVTQVRPDFSTSVDTAAVNGMRFPWSLALYTSIKCPFFIRIISTAELGFLNSVSFPGLHVLPPSRDSVRTTKPSFIGP